MLIVFVILFSVFLLLPVGLWWIRNVTRIFFKKDLYLLSDNLVKIALVCLALALIFGILMGLAVANII